jgi:site-specific DNA recombinase
VNSIRKTTKVLNDQGIRPRQAARWRLETVYDILRNPVYVGRMVWGRYSTDPISHTKNRHAEGRIEAQGQHSALIAQETFDQAQALLKARAFKPTRARRFYLLSGLVWCGECGEKYTGNALYKGGAFLYAYYHCKGRKGDPARCQCPNYRTEVLEQAVITAILDKSRDTHFLTNTAAWLAGISGQIDTDDPTSEQNALDRQIDEQRRKIDSLLNVMIDQGYQADPLFKTKYEALKTALTGLEAQRERLNHRKAEQWADFETVKTALDRVNHFGTTWAGLTDDHARRDFLRGMIDKVVITREQVEVRFPTDNEALLQALENSGVRTSGRHTFQASLFAPLIAVLAHTRQQRRTNKPIR